MIIVGSGTIPMPIATPTPNATGNERTPGSEPSSSEAALQASARRGRRCRLRGPFDENGWLSRRHQATEMKENAIGTIASISGVGSPIRKRLSFSPACPSQEGHAGGMNENSSGALAPRPSDP